MRRVFWPALGLTAAVAFLLGLVAAGSQSSGFFASRAGHPVASAAIAPGPALAGPAPLVSAPDFSAIVSRAESAVVSVRAATRGSTDRPSAHARYLGEAADPPAPREESGSGFVIDPAGGILTNYHVIQGADRISVTLADKRVFKASVVGVDEAIDVALLQVDAQDPLPVVAIGHSETLRVGEWVCAIGSPIGYANSVTVGVVSFLDRKVAQWNLDGVIQTDAAMSPGSSGSPLLNTAGQVVGITAAFSAQSANIGFAIPISQVVAVLPEMRERGRVSRGYIDIGLTSLTPELRTALRLEPPRGALVEDVPTDRVADRGGIQTYDVIVAIDGEPVSSDAEAIHLIAAKRPGTVARLDVWRDGSARTLSVRLEERPVPPTPGTGAPSPAIRAAASPAQGPLGMTVRELDPATIRSLPAGMSGIRVVDVDAAGPARLAHVRLGQVVIEINRQPVRTTAEFDAVVGALHPGGVAALLVYEPFAKEYAILSILLDQRP